MTQEAYPEYKDSGVAWLGDVPTHWGLLKSKYAFGYKKGFATKPDEPQEDGSPLITMAYLRGDLNPELVKQKSHDIKIEDGNTLILWDGANAGEILKGKSGVLSATLAVIIYKSNIEENFVWYLLKAFEKNIRQRNTGMGIPHVNSEFFSNFSCVIPPLAEQKAIADFLDRGAARIDSLIEKKKRQLELLKEKRATTISQAVTRGLNPAAPTKDSGVAWLGDVPTHWDINPLFALMKKNQELNANRFDNVLSLSYGNIVRRNVDSDFGLLPESFSSYQVLQEGYVIIRSTDLQNDKKSLRVGLAKEQGIITSAYLGLIPSNQLDARYAYQYLHHCDIKKIFYGLGGGLRQSLRFEEFRRFPMLLPPLAEQKKIADFLDRETARMDKLADITRESITLIKERRTALITAAVTGQIKVV